MFFVKVKMRESFRRHVRKHLIMQEQVASRVVVFFFLKALRRLPSVPWDQTEL